MLLDVPKHKKPLKRRIDLLLVEKGIAETQAKAAALVLSGRVAANSKVVTKPGTPVGEDSELVVAGPDPFVGRGGLKLEHALRSFGIDVTGLIVLDVGASTGGFTDCLLKHGAAKVYAVDVGKGQLDWRLRRDARVIVMEGVNARYPLELPERMDLVTVDVSFISATKIIPPAAATLKRGGRLVVLVKPQFEGDRVDVGKGGIVRDPRIHAKVLGRFVAWMVNNGFRLLDMVASPVAGAEGNREFFVHLVSTGSGTDSREPRGKSPDPGQTS